MDDRRCDAIHSLFGKVIRVEFSKDPETSNARGVAFVLNKNLVGMENIKTTELVPGRAMLLEMQNVDGSPLSILGVYAPNVPAENAAFWTTLKAWFVAHPRVRRPDIMGGDTNIVEDALDRLPSRPDAPASVTALDDLKIYLHLIDGWRETFPTKLEYTYHQIQTGSQSRLDRFYVRRDIFDQTFEWDIKTPGIKTDHKMITVKLTTEKAPTIGHGRWVWPAHLTKDKILTKYIHERGITLQQDLEVVSSWRERDANYNKQTLWAKFKLDITDKARNRAKIIVAKIIQEIAALETKLDLILAEKGISAEEKKLSAAVLTRKLSELQQKRHQSTRMSVQMKNRLEGEIIGRYWSRVNKPNKPRELIHRLKKPGGPPGAGPVLYETDSSMMATLARNYHNKLQSERDDTPTQVREEKINTVLGRTSRTVTPEQAASLKAQLTIDDVRAALKLSANFKAPGLDGSATSCGKPWTQDAQQTAH
jgi:hypothetical protein